MSSADQEKVKRRRFEPKIWDTLRRVYESVGLALSLQKVLELSAAALGYELDDMPTIKGIESKITRQRWVAGLKKIDLFDDREKLEGEPENSGQNNDFEGENDPKSDIQTVREEISEKYQQKFSNNSAKFQQENKSDDLSGDQKEFLIDFVDQFLVDRKEIMERHKTDFLGYAKEIKIATDFALHPIDLSGDEMAYRRSRAIADLGKARIGLIAQSIEAMSMLQMREKDIFGFDYKTQEEIEPETVKEMTADEAKKLVEVRGDIHAFYEAQAKRFARDRQELQGRGEVVANELSGVNLDHTDEFDSTPMHDPYNDRQIRMDAERDADQERDFTDTLPSDGIDEP